MPKLRIMIVDDHVVFCESLALLLSIKGETEIVATANSGESALKKIERLKPDVVLMDLEMKGLDGLTVTRKVRERFPDVRVIMLTMHSEEQYVLEAIKAGANGYVLKDYSSSSIVDAIKAVGKGEVFFDPKSSGKILKNLKNQFNDRDRGNKSEHFLSRRETEILKLIVEGCANKEISAKLFISIHTVRNHIANIFSKMECHTRIKAVREAQKRDFI